MPQRSDADTPHASAGAVSRRAFLRGGAAAAAAIAAATPTQADAKGRARGPQVEGPSPIPIRFTLDGKKVGAKATPERSLLDVLHHDLDATAAKEACGRGACGACSVLIDGELRLACLTFAVDVDKARVETARSLAGAADAPTALARAFVREDALQCGYCTPGFLVAATAALASKQPLDRAEVTAALAGNLCRCGSHPHLVDAVLAAQGAR